VLSLLGAVVLAQAAAPQRGRRAHGLAWLGLAGLAAAFVSPLCALSSALFSVRVAHHLVLIGFAAPVLAMAWPKLPTLNLGLLTILHAALLWTWHAPAAYAAALASDPLYWLMQASLFLPALLFWRAVFAASAPAAAAGLLAFMAQMGLLGALLSFAPTALYSPHAFTPFSWGLTPLQDQQLGGLIMWAPASMLYLVAALARLYRWLGQSPVAV